jgi:hypothetical protein
VGRGRHGRPAREVAPLIGDILHSFHSALDHLGWQQAFRKSYGHPPVGPRESEAPAEARVGLLRSTGGIVAVPFEGSGLPLQPPTEHPDGKSQEGDDDEADPDPFHLVSRRMYLVSRDTHDSGDTCPFSDEMRSGTSALLESGRMRKVRTLTARTIRAVTLVIRDRRIPRPLRWAGGLALLPIPGPFDEAVLLIVAVPLLLFYREPMGEAWEATAVVDP